MLSLIVFLISIVLMDVIQRVAALEDAGEVNNLSKQLGYDATVSETAERLRVVIEDKMHCAYVAVVEGLVIGWIHGFYATRIESAPFVEIGGLVVDANARGAGVGRKLVQQVMEWSVQRAITRIRIRTNTARFETHQFYQKTGFTETKEQKVFDLKL